MYKAPMNFELTEEQADIIAAELNKENSGCYLATCSARFGLKTGWGVVALAADEDEVSELITFDNAPVERYTGLNLLLDTEQGYHAGNGSDSFGFHDTLDDLKAEIDEYWAGEEHGPLNGCFA